MIGMIGDKNEEKNTETFRCRVFNVSHVDNGGWEMEMWLMSVHFI